jgi:hypothetical protein
MVFIVKTKRGCRRPATYVIYTHGPDYALQRAMELYYNGDIPKKPVKFTVQTMVQIAADAWA